MAQEIEKVFDRAPDFAEHVRRYLENKYGRDMLYRQGLKVYTTVNLSMQKAAESALRKGLLELDKREGYRGPLRHLKLKKGRTTEKRGQAWCRKSLLGPVMWWKVLWKGSMTRRRRCGSSWETVRGSWPFRR
jgi:membrane carboxypeptidase/penicillin-binding protein